MLGLPMFAFVKQEACVFRPVRVGLQNGYSHCVAFATDAVNDFMLEDSEHPRFKSGLA